MTSYPGIQKNHNGDHEMISSPSPSTSALRERKVRLGYLRLVIFVFLATLGVSVMLSIFFSRHMILAMALPPTRKLENQVQLRGNPVEEKDQNPSPKLIWLMSFPNSGTSFTSDLVRHIGKVSTASNYGKEFQDVIGNSIAVYSNLTGPFWIDSSRANSDFTRPTKYALTKTHCGGRCGRCAPQRWIETPQSFFQQCLSGEQVYWDEEEGRHFIRPVSYDASRVAKAVHLIRNPIDNFVSRFHLYVKRSKKFGRESKFTKDREGFRSFCHDLIDTKQQDSELLDQEVLKHISKVPCHADVFRYVQWHNLAFHATLEEMKIPTHVLHYENYETRFEKTVDGLVDFLELEKKGDAIEFIRGKEYHNYFTLEERQSIAWAMKKLATKTTWENIQHYFTE